jgi:GTPase involved in cell partitioning and DNA repair
MDFIRNVERYVELHQNLIDVAKTTKDMRKEKTILGKELLEYMMSHNIKEHAYEDFELINNEKEVKNKMSLEIIEGMLEQFNNEVLDQQKIDSIISAIANSEMSGDIKNSLSIKKKKGEKKPRKSKKQTEAENYEE